MEEGWENTLLAWCVYEDENMRVVQYGCVSFVQGVNFFRRTVIESQVSL